MAMNYTSLVAAKGVSGSIANFVSYSRLDLPPILDEAQALLWTYLRTREMLTKFSFNIPLYGSVIALPSNFLEAAGRLFVPSVNCEIMHKDASYVLRSRNYNETSGTLGTNPFTTASGSSKFSVSLTAHGFNQESPISFSGTTSANGINFNGTFDIVTITDANNFVVDTLTQTATGSGADGGATVAYLCDNLQTAFPEFFAIWDEAIHFDGAFPQAYNMQMLCYRSPPLLSASNQTNFLTNRYPQLLRTACQASAADFMKDSDEYTKCVQRLQGYVQAIMIENDGQYRGLELDAETP